MLQTMGTWHQRKVNQARMRFAMAISAYDHASA